MADETPATVGVDALRALLDAKGVDQLRAATPGTVAFDTESERWTRPTTADSWYDGAGNEVTSQQLDLWLPEITHVGVPIVVLRELLDAYAQRDRLRADLRAGGGELNKAAELDAARGAGDRAMTVAVALHNQNAVYEKTADEFTKRRAEEEGALGGPDPWADVKTLRAAMERVRNEDLATVEDYGAAGIDPSESTDAIVIVTAALAATDPARTER